MVSHPYSAWVEQSYKTNLKIMALRQTSWLEDLMILHPRLQYIDGELWEDDELIEKEGDEVLRQHFDGFEVTISHSSGNPELETFETVSGSKYIELKFGNDYKEAFENV